MVVSDEDLAIIRELDAAFLSVKNELASFSQDEEKKYELLQESIKKYKEGNREAAEYIIKRFHPFLSKFTKYIKYNQIPTEIRISRRSGKTYRYFDASIKSFIALYVTADEARNIMDKNKCHKDGVFWYVRDKVSNRFSSYSYTDIYNELVLALLNMVNKYKITKEGDKYHKKNGTFHMYVQRCFHFEAKRFLDKLTKDTTEHCIQVPLIPEDYEGEDTSEEAIEDENAAISFVKATETASRDNMIKRSKKLIMKEFYEVDAYDEDCLNFNWTSGVTCSEVFKSLTPIEREIIVLIYIKNMPLIKIAKIYGTSKDMVRRYHKSAVTKIKENMQNAS